MRSTSKTPNSKSTLNERLHKARQRYNLALVAAAVSIFISLTGVEVVLTGKASVGADITTGGMAATVQCIQSVKDTNDRLDRILAELKDEE